MFFCFQLFYFSFSLNQIFDTFLTKSLITSSWIVYCPLTLYHGLVLAKGFFFLSSTFFKLFFLRLFLQSLFYVTESLTDEQINALRSCGFINRLNLNLFTCLDEMNLVLRLRPLTESDVCRSTFLALDLAQVELHAETTAWLPLSRCGEQQKLDSTKDKNGSSRIYEVAPPVET